MNMTEVISHLKIDVTLRIKCYYIFKHQRGTGEIRSGTSEIYIWIYFFELITIHTYVKKILM